ncbi:MAG: ribonuclease HI family protein [Actinomycetota bacterium]
MTQQDLFGESLEELLIYCDGGSRGNPGPAALGVSIQDPSGTEIEGVGETLGTQTNNFAEYSAVIRALGRAAELGARRVKIRTDSQLLVQQLRGVYKVKSANLRPLFEQARAAACRFEKVVFEHVPREQNVRADELVNLALDAKS